MTILAFQCAQLDIPFDSFRLWAGDHPDYQTWLGILVDMVSEANRVQAEKLNRGRR